MLDEDEGDEDDDDEFDDIVGDDDDSVVVALTVVDAVAADAAVDLPFSSIRFVDMELFRELFWLFDDGGVLGPLLIDGVRVAAELVVAFPPPVVRSDVLESEFNDVDDVLA